MTGEKSVKFRKLTDQQWSSEEKIQGLQDLITRLRSPLVLGMQTESIE